MNTGGRVHRCVFVPDHTSGETTHDTASSTHDQRHDRSRTRREHQGVVPAFVTRLARHYRRSPEQISAREVQDYLLFLHQQHGLSWSTCNTIRHGVRFFFRITLGLPDPHFYVPGAKEPSTLPQILNHDELVRLFTVTTNLKHRAVLMTAYAAGLRASELGRLQVSDIDSDRTLSPRKYQNPWGQM